MNVDPENLPIIETRRDFARRLGIVPKKLTTLIARGRVILTDDAEMVLVKESLEQYNATHNIEVASRLSKPALLNHAEFAELVGVKANYLSELAATGRILLTDNNRFIRVQESIDRIQATRDPSKAGVAARHAAERGAAARTGHAETEPNQALAPAESAQAATETIAPTTAPQPPEGEGAARGYDYQNSKAKREHFAAMEAEASYRQKMRELLDAGEVRAAMVEALTVLRTSMEGLPYNLAPVLAATSDEAQIKSLMSAEVEHALKTAADSLAKLGRGEL